MSDPVESLAADSAGTSLALSGGELLPMSIYDRIPDALDFVNKFGQAMAKSCMFGCANDDQGRVLAMACACERTNPIALTRKYHIIGGKLSMRSDAMLAEFRARGGTHEIIERTPERAAVRLTITVGRKQQSHDFSLSWAEAEQEPFVRDGKGGIKDNYKTPRARMQMLWARVISDGVRTVMPEVVAGVYTPEELGGGDADLDEPTAVQTLAPAKASKVVTKPAAAVTAGTKVIDVEATKPAPSIDPATNELRKIEIPQLVEMKKLKTKLGLDQEMWAAYLEHYGVKSATELEYAQADELLSNLMRRADEKTDRDSMSQWADSALGSPAG